MAERPIADYHYGNLQLLPSSTQNPLVSGRTGRGLGTGDASKNSSLGVASTIGNLS